MKKIINKFKLYFLIFTIFIILIFFALKNEAFKSSIYNNIWKKLSEKNQFIVKLIFQKEFRKILNLENIMHDYNEKFLPFTQFEKLNIKKEIIFLVKYPKNTSYFQEKINSHLSILNWYLKIKS